MEIGNYYYHKLKLNKNIQILPPSNHYSKNIYWMVGVLIKNKKINTKQITKKLLSYGIQTRPFFWPISEQEIFKKLKIFKNTENKFLNSKYLSNKDFYLPSYLKITNNAIDFIYR